MSTTEEAVEQFDQNDFPEDFEIHQSHIGAMHSCPAEYEARYVEGIIPDVGEHAKRYGPMTRGTVTHKVSAFCRGKPRDGGYSVDDAVDLMQKAWAANEEAQQLPEAELPKWETHGLWITDHLEAHKDEQVIEVEGPLSTEERPVWYRGLLVQGRVDEVVRPNGNGQLLIRDLKTGKITPSAVNLVSNVQAGLYTWAAKQRVPGEVGFEVWHMPKSRPVPADGPLVLSEAELVRFEREVLDPYLAMILAGIYPRNTQRQYGGCASCMYQAHCWGRI